MVIWTITLGHNIEGEEGNRTSHLTDLTEAHISHLSTNSSSAPCPYCLDSTVSKASPPRGILRYCCPLLWTSLKELANHPGQLLWLNNTPTE